MTNFTSLSVSKNERFEALCYYFEFMVLERKFKSNKPYPLSFVWIQTNIKNKERIFCHEADDKENIYVVKSLFIEIFWITATEFEQSNEGGTSGFDRS